MSLAFLTAVAIAVQASSPAPMVTGEVLDPGSLPVAGAVVRVECGPLAASVETDRRGRFDVRPPIAAADCVVEVLRDGFVTWRQPVRSRGDIKVRLALAAHHEALTVRAPRDTASRPASGTVDGDRLRQMTNTPDAMLQLALAMSGASQPDQRVYVDGAPRAVLPTAERVGQVAVNLDPFSAAFGDLDGARVEVETAPLDRAWRYTISASPGSVSAGHPLGAGHQWNTTSLVAGVSGPMPGTSLAWSAGVRRITRDQESPLLSMPQAAGPPPVTQGREQIDGIYAVASYQRAATRVIADLNAQDNRAFASGAGALVLPEAATDVRSRLVELNVSVRCVVEDLTLRSSGTVRFNTFSSQARSEEQGFTGAGSFVAGGSAVTADQTRSSLAWWSGRVEGVARGRPWLAGASVNASSAHNVWTPNTRGVVTLAPDRSRRLFTQVEIGSGTSSHAERAIGAFVEMQMIRNTRATMTTGVRVDARRGEPIAVSPRMSAAITLLKTTVSVGAGQFVEEWDAASLLPLYARAAGGTTFTARDEDEMMVGAARVAISPRQQRLASIAANRPWREVEFAGEYRWSWTEDVPSLARGLTPSGWSEMFGSTARRRAEEARARASIGRGERTVVTYYTWRRSTDTADGWWGSPVSSIEPMSWAPTSGIAAHEAGILLAFRAPGAINATLAGTLSSGRVMDLLLAPRTMREALAAPLRPVPRNSATGPSTASVQLFASRAVRVEALRLKGRVGTQVTNLLGRRNLLAPVNVVGSPFYGRATDAGAARSVSVWFALGRGGS